MEINRGKYDDLCALVRNGAQAEGVVLLVLNGELGSSFSYQIDAKFVRQIPKLLETMAQQIAAEHAQDPIK